MRCAVFTSGRQDWGILAPVCRAIAASPVLTLLVVAGGMHCRERNPIELDGLRVDAVVPALPRGDDDHAVARAAADTTRMLADALRDVRAECLLILGDRTETLAAALAAACLRLPLVHLHGGEETVGAIDNACRHAISRLAQLHAVAHAAFAERLIAWGEPRERVVVSGAPALDGLLHGDLPDAEELGNHLRRPLGTPLLILTHHPTTLGAMSPDAEVRAVLDGTVSALVGCAKALVVMTRANVDAGGVRINTLLAEQAAKDRRFVLAGDLGSRRWWGLMAQATAMVGNSSSGILEAPCFDLPVVNVGDRQQGRLRIGPCTDVAPAAWAVAAALRQALDHPRPLPAKPHATAYGDGAAAARIATALESLAHRSSAERLRKSP